MGYVSTNEKGDCFKNGKCTNKLGVSEVDFEESDSEVFTIVTFAARKITRTIAISLNWRLLKNFVIRI